MHVNQFFCCSSANRLNVLLKSMDNLAICFYIECLSHLLHPGDLFVTKFIMECNKFIPRHRTNTSEAN